MSHTPSSSPDVLMGQLGCSHECLVGVSQLVVNLVALAETTQNEDGLLHRGLRHLERKRSKVGGEGERQIQEMH